MPQRECEIPLGTTKIQLPDPQMHAQSMLKFVKVFCRDLQGKQENAIFLNANHVVKIELAACGAEEVSSIITLVNGEKLEVAGTPEDLLTHEQYFYPKPKEVG